MNNCLTVQPYNNRSNILNSHNVVNFGAKKVPNFISPTFTNPIMPDAGPPLSMIKNIPVKMVQEIEELAYKKGIATATLIATALGLKSASNNPEPVASKSAVVGNSRVSTLIDGEQYFKKAIDTVKNAKSSILLEMFEFQNLSVDGNYWAKNGATNTPGAKEQQQLLWEIVKKKEENPDMKIQIILDSHKWYIDGKGNRVKHYGNQDMIRFLKEKGIDVVPYPRAAQQGSNLQHKKLLVVDNKTALLGGMNWGTHSAANHDMNVVIERLAKKKNSEVDNIVNEIFIPDWKFSWERLGETRLIAGPLSEEEQSNYSGINKEIKQENVQYNELLKEFYDTPEAKNRYRENRLDLVNTNPVENSKIKILQTRPNELENIGEKGLETTREFVMEKLNTAKKLRAYSFVLTDKEFIETLSRRYNAGELDAEIIVEDHSFPYCRSALEKLMESGVPVRIYNSNQNTNQRMHAKCLVFDDKTVVIGSTNLSGQGLTQNLDRGFRDDYEYTVSTIDEKILETLSNVKERETKLQLEPMNWTGSKEDYEKLKTRQNEIKKAYTKLKNNGKVNFELDGKTYNFEKDIRHVTVDGKQYDFKENDGKDALAELRTIIGYYNIIKIQHNSKPKYKRGNNELMVAFDSPSLAKNVFEKMFKADWAFSETDFDRLKKKFIPIKRLDVQG